MTSDFTCSVTLSFDDFTSIVKVFFCLGFGAVSFEILFFGVGSFGTMLLSIWDRDIVSLLNWRAEGSSILLRIRRKGTLPLKRQVRSDQT